MSESATIGHNSEAVVKILLAEPEALFQDPTMLDQLVDELRAEIVDTPIELDTAKGRSVITKLASRITTFKTTLDKTGKHLNEGHREAISKVDVVRRRVRSSLDELKELARKPLTDWEDAEHARNNQIQVTSLHIETLGEVGFDEDSAKITERINGLEAIEIPEDVFRDQAELYIQRKASTLERLKIILEKQVQAEKDAAELKQIRAEMEAKAAAEAKAQRAAEQARIEAERKEREEAERKASEERAAKAAADAAKRKVEAEARAKIDAERKQREAAEAELQRQERERQRIAQEKAEREADEAHRSQIMRGIETALIEQANISAETAQLITLAITAGNVPNVSVEF